MTQFIFDYQIKQRGLENVIETDSASTSREEIGNGPHYGTVNKLREAGIPILKHRAVQMTKSDYETDMTI